MNSKVKISGINTNELTVIKEEDMKKLFKKKDKKSREEIINGNLKLVLSVLQKYKDKGADDLFQIGCIGLIKAVDNFDITLGVKFSTYAVPMIDGEIRRYLRDNKLIRVSRSIKDLAYKKLKLEEEQGKLTKEELEKKLNATPYEISLAEDAFKDPISIFKPVYEDGSETIYLCDEISDKNDGRDVCSHIALYDAIRMLKEKEKYILNERYINGKTQEEIGQDLLISQAQVSRIEKGAVKKLKKTLKY